MTAITIIPRTLNNAACCRPVAHPGSIQGPGANAAAGLQAL